VNLVVKLVLKVYLTWFSALFQMNYCYILKQFDHDKGKAGVQFNFSLIALICLALGSITSRWGLHFWMLM